MSKFKIKGIDKLQKQLKNMERATKKLKNNTTFNDLFTPSFMRKNTKFGSFEDFLTAGNFNVESQEDFEAIPDDEMDQHVIKNTKFKNWPTMLETASSEYLQKKIGL